MKENFVAKKRTTIYDIATQVGTSVATVSRVLGNSDYPVKDELRRRIVVTAAKMHYSPNIIGRVLKKKESMDIGIIVPTISNPFYSHVILGIELEARKRGYNILLCDSFMDDSTEKKYIESLCQKQVRGIILSSINENHVFFKRIQEEGTKIVVFDQSTSDVKCDQVEFDYFKGGMIAVDYLIQMGHKRIAFLTSPLRKKSRRKVLEGYKYALIKNGLSFQDDLVIITDSEGDSEEGNNEFENGKRLAKKFLKMTERPSAIFTVNDITAFGIIQGLFDNGIKVPEDVSIIGFDNLDISSMINPPLTTVNQPAYETGRQACKMLLDGMNENREENLSITLEPHLVIRNSVRNIQD